MKRNSNHTRFDVKTDPAPLPCLGELEYPYHERSCEVYSQWWSGFQAEDIAQFFGIDVKDVHADILHIQRILPNRTATAHKRDRNKILALRAAGERHQQALSKALSTPAEALLQAGVSPVSALRKFRAAVGMVEEGRLGKVEKVGK